MTQFKSVLAFMVAFAFISAAQASQVFFEKDSSLPIVNFNVVFKTGSVDDPKTLEGISHITAEMLLRGTVLRSKEVIDADLDFMGADMAVETRAEAVIIRGVFLSSQQEAFLKLLEEILTRPAFREVEFAKLKSETTSSILEEQGKDNTLAMRRYGPFLFGNHPYGNSISGTIKSVARMSIQDVRNHYQKYFRAQRMVVLGTGDADESKISAWEKPVDLALTGGEPIRSVAPPAALAQKKLLFINKPDRTQTQVLIGRLGVKMDDPMFFPLHVGNFAFGGGTFSARMMKEIRVKRGWSYGAYSHFRFGSQPRSWHMYYFPAAKDSAQALTLGLGMLRDLRDKGITSDEFEFAKDSLISSSAFAYNTPKKRVENQILEKTLGLPDGYMKSYAKRINEVKLEQVNAALKTFLADDHLAILFLGTAKDLKDPIIQASGALPADVQIKEFTEE